MVHVHVRRMIRVHVHVGAWCVSMSEGQQECMSSVSDVAVTSGE